MGYNTPVLIYNDMLGSLKRDPEIGPKIDSAIGRAFMTQEPEHIHAIGGSVGIALPSEHADVARTIVMGGNDAVEIGKGHWSDIPYKEDKIEPYLRNLVDQLGYRLVKKSRT